MSRYSPLQAIRIYDAMAEVMSDRVKLINLRAINKNDRKMCKDAEKVINNAFKREHHRELLKIVAELVLNGEITYLGRKNG